MQRNFAWAQRPMLQRIPTDLDPDLPVSIIYGSNSWAYRVNNSVMELFRQARPESYVATHLIENASHHVHADKPEDFNAVVKNILRVVDSGADL